VTLPKDIPCVATEDLFDNPIFDAIQEADLVEVDDRHSIRYFGLDIDGVSDVDDVILTFEITDNEYQKYEFDFTINDLNQAKYNKSTDQWLVPWGGDTDPVSLKFSKITSCHSDPDAVKAALAAYQSDDIQIDDNANITEVQDGCWVNAWLWVPNTQSY
jgi:hypothetical protein